MHARIRGLGVLVVVLALGAACGDDDTDTRTQGGKTAEDPTKAEFIAASDEICAGYIDQMDEVFAGLFTGEEPEPAAVQEGFGKVLDIYSKQLSDLRGLTPPKDDEAAIAGLLDDGEKVVADTRAEIASLARTMELFSSDEDPFSAWNEKMAGYGFEACAGESEDETEAFGGAELTAEEQAKATKVTVKGMEYGYEGVPATLTAGPAIFSFTNGGGENHEIGIVRVKDGVSADEAITMAKENPEDDAFVAAFLGAAYALPGDSIDLSVKLEPGLYAYGCFVETSDGTPHAVHGMIDSFTVAG